MGVILTLFGAHEDEFVTPSAPGGLDVLGPGHVILRAGHHPAQHAHPPVQVSSQARFLCITGNNTSHQQF
jgi:hypothetical protein